MEHEKLMEHATRLTAAFIQNGDLRHCGNFQDDGRSVTHEQVRLLLIQMYRAISEAAFESHQTSWSKRAKGEAPDPSGTA